jgi:hypothetical protein
MKKNNYLNGFTIFMAIIVLLTLVLNMINGRFYLCDFKVYYTATANLISGGPVYLVSFDSGSGFYKYSPATLFFFLPYQVFNFKTAEIIHFSILGIAYWYTMILIWTLIREYFITTPVKHEVWLVSISFICILIHFTREMSLGNINIILLMLCCLAILSIISGKDLKGGILLGIVVLAKPYLLILLLPLLLRKKWRVIMWLSVTILCGLIIPFIFPGPKASIALYGDWIKSILLHGEGYPGMTSLDYFIRNLVSSWPSWGILVIFFTCYALIAVFITANIRSEKQDKKETGLANRNFAFECFILIALLPNLIKTDWVLLLFSAPLITFMVFYIAFQKRYWWIPVMIIIIFFYGANSDDLLGRSLSHTILQSGLMGLGNFLLVIVSLVMFLHLRKTPARIPKTTN